MTKDIENKIEFACHHFGLEAPITIAVSAIAEKASAIGEDTAYEYINGLLDLALAEERLDLDEDYDEEPDDCDLEMGFDPYMGSFSWDC